MSVSHVRTALVNPLILADVKLLKIGKLRFKISYASTLRKNEVNPQSRIKVLK
ncbi:hypothetical protein YN1HA_26480 [Sulfurisphaera ohwakuensis]